MILTRMPKGVKFFNAVVCPIFFKNGTTVVLQKRYDHPIYPGLWGFPAGKVKPSDVSVEAAILREIEEETGIIYDVSDLIGPTVVPARHQKLNKQYFYFTAYIYKINSEDGHRIKIDKKEHRNSLVIPWQNVLATSKKHLIPDAHETLFLLKQK